VRNCLDRLHARAPIRLLPIRAPRQAVLRTSSWLAPSFAKRSCDLPAKKTRDASNRRLPPNRTACTRTSCVPSSWRHFRGGDAPRRLRLHVAVDWGTGCFTTSESALADRHSVRSPRALLPHGLESRAWAFSSHGTDAIEPLTPLSRPRFSSSRLTRLRESCNLAVCLLFEGLYGSENVETAKVIVRAVS